MLHFMAIPLQSYLNLLLTQHIPTLLSLTLPILLLHATAIIFCASAHKIPEMHSDLASAGQGSVR